MTMDRSRAFKIVATLLLALMLALAVGCAKEPAETPEPKPEPVEMVLASTTSTQDSGLFDVLIPAFEEANEGVKVQVVAVGTGEAIEMGRRGDADALLVHSKADEEALVEEGVATSRENVMYNQFIFVGPAGDPAGLGNAATAVDAIKMIADNKISFVSRGDDSGTHKAENRFWKAAGIEPKGDWYKSAGAGMGDTLKMADEMGAYTYTDEATFLRMKKDGAIELEVALKGADGLLNQYGVLVIDGAKQQEAAQKFFDWILSAEGQKVIADYGIEEFGSPLFTPNAGK